MADQEDPAVVWGGLVRDHLRPENDANEVIFSQLVILGVLHHVTFLKVKKDADGYWETCSPEWNAELERLHALAESDGQLMTVKLQDYLGDYLCYVYPFTV